MARARPILEKPDQEPSPTLIPMLRIAAAVALSQNRVAAAAADMDKALELLRRFGRDESLEYGTSLGDRGLVAARQSRHEDAARFFREAIVLLERFGAARHPATAITLLNLAVSLDSLGRKQDAQTARAKARDILRGYRFIVKPPDRWI